MRPATHDRLVAVRDVFEDAVRRGQPPIVAVAAAFKISPTAARSVVARARRAGVLSHARHQLVHVPTTAVIHPYGVGRREWQVCGECLVTWPCPHWRSNAKT